MNIAAGVTKLALLIDGDNVRATLMPEIMAKAAALTKFPRSINASLVVPPPISTTMLPVGVSTGRPTPIAAAIGSATM